jgi:RHS repeat-associated protein
MKNTISSLKMTRASFFGLSLAVLLFLFSVSASAQITTTSVTDGRTPQALTPGSPVGSYALSGFDSVNLYNGNLNFRLPLLAVGGRGAAQMTMMLALNLKSWHVKHFNKVQPGENDINSYTPTQSGWAPYSGYGAGRFSGRSYGLQTSSNASCRWYSITLARLTFSTADGTEYELRDQRTGGQPLSSTCTQGADRGTVFVTADGTSATFTSDNPIYDIPTINISGPTGFSVSGELTLRDGTKYRIDGGNVTWIRDRNGNKLSFSYTTSSMTITDSLNRTVTVNYDVSDVTHGLCDQIVFSGFGGAQRVILVSHTNLGSALRPNSGYAIKTLGGPNGLFPELNGSSTTTYDPIVTSAVWLPDGRSYKLYYNSYGEVARVELPTGGAFEYDMTPGSGVVYACPTCNQPDDDKQIYRRVVERRIYPDGSTGASFEHKEVYTDSEAVGSAISTVTVEQRSQSGTVLERSRHYFDGSALDSLFGGAVAYPYGTWYEGNEKQTDDLDTTGEIATATVLRRTVYARAQRTSVTWWAAYANAHSLDQTKEPPNDPRLTSTVTTIEPAGANLVTMQTAVSPQNGTVGFDQFNNQTDVWEYDYGQNGAVGALVRHMHTEYANATNLINGVDYTTTAIHLRSLPVKQQVFDSSGVERARTVYEYDNYTTNTLHAALKPCPNISGLEAVFADANTPYTRRGNVTSVTSYTNAAALTGAITTAMQYDVAGNVVKAVDGRGKAVTSDYASAYQYAFPTSVTSPVPDPNGLSGSSSAFVTTTNYDLWTGHITSTVDANQQVMSYQYDDPLDRLTKVTRPGGGQTIYEYGDMVGNLYLRTQTQLDASPRWIDASEYFDGLGRSVRAEQSEGATVITSRQEYDALGRVKRTYNPYRTTNDETYGWTEMSYDALSRVTKVETFKAGEISTGAVVTAYSGNTVTVTDQAGKQRKSVTDALGRLTTIYEAPNDASYNYQTSYQYDALGNLRTVNQGAQARIFTYDSLSRLISAQNPESGTTQYSYDENGNLQTKTDARGTQTAYTYDALNRITGRSYSGGTAAQTPTVTYRYDTAGIANSKGRLTKVSSSVSVTNYAAYDALGRVTSSSQQTNGQTYSLSYEYDLAGNLTREIYPSGRLIEHSFDAAGRIASVTGHKVNADTLYASQLSYTAHGAVASLKLGNSTAGNERWEHTTFNSRLQPTEIGLGNMPGSSSLLKLEYRYGVLAGGSLETTQNNGNVQSQVITVPGLSPLTQAYTYDALNRLTKASETGGQNPWTQAFVYDESQSGQAGGRYGNRRIDTSQTSANVQPVSNPSFELASNRIAAGQGYGYDLAGNVTSDPSYSYSYDGENRMVSSVDGEAHTTSYHYDGDGRRVQKVSLSETSVFVYDAMGQMVAEYNDSTPVSENQTSYLTSDSLGTPRVVTKADGSVKARHDYLPYGEEVTGSIGGRDTVPQYAAADGVKQKFASKQRDDETGLDFSEARYYASTQGRFTSIDPILITEGRLIDPQQINLYNYARNNPLRFSDPTGEDIDDSSLADNEDYQKWKTAFLKTKTGHDFWEKYNKPEYKVTISMGENAGGKGGAETTPTFDANGKLTGGAIVLGTEFAKKEASPEYPIGHTLTPDSEDGNGRPQISVSREARAVAFLAHEFGHLEDGERMGGAAWKRENDFIKRNQEGFNKLGGQWSKSPEYKKLLSECRCSNPSDIGTRREIRADGYTRGVLRDYYDKGAGHGSMPNRVKKAIQAYEKGNPR